MIFAKHANTIFAKIHTKSTNIHIKQHQNCKLAITHPELQTSFMPKCYQTYVVCNVVQLNDVDLKVPIIAVLGSGQKTQNGKHHVCQTLLLPTLQTPLFAKMQKQFHAKNMSNHTKIVNSQLPTQNCKHHLCQNVIKNMLFAMLCSLTI